MSRSAGGTTQPDGVIDFGDLTNSWAVSELAITASSVLGHAGAEPTSVLPAVRAFHAIRPLTPAEVDALWPMLVLRTVVLIVSGAQQKLLDPDNPYLTNQSGGERRMFEQATSIPIDVMTEVIKADLGVAARPAAVAVSTPMADAGSVATLDLSTTSDVYDFAFEPDGSLRRGIEDELARAAVQDGARLVVTQYGEARLSRTRRLSHESPTHRRDRHQPVGGVDHPTRRTVGRPDRRGRTDATWRRLRADADRGERHRVGQGECRRAAGRRTCGAVGGGRCTAGRRTRRAAVHPVRAGARLAGADA